MWGRLVLLLALAAPAHAQTVIIYSRADSNEAHRAWQFVEALVGPAQIDRQLKPGAPWRASIAKWICEAERVLLVWSVNAAASAEVQREIHSALWCRVPIVPVLLDSTPLPGLVGDVQAIDLRTPHVN